MKKYLLSVFMAIVLIFTLKVQNIINFRLIMRCCNV